jgi:hypothetical protein
MGRSFEIEIEREREREREIERRWSHRSQESLKVWRPDVFNRLIRFVIDRLSG